MFTQFSLGIFKLPAPVSLTFLYMYRYVLLKERNMLLTLKHEAKRAGFVMPGPERAWKVISAEWTFS